VIQPRGLTEDAKEMIRRKNRNLGIIDFLGTVVYPERRCVSVFMKFKMFPLFM
jgi:hypothetical protein